MVLSLLCQRLEDKLRISFSWCLLHDTTGSTFWIRTHAFTESMNKFLICEYDFILYETYDPAFRTRFLKYVSCSKKNSYQLNNTYLKSKCFKRKSSKNDWLVNSSCSITLLCCREVEDIVKMEQSLRSILLGILSNSAITSSLHQDLTFEVPWIPNENLVSS